MLFRTILFLVYMSMFVSLTVSDINNEKRSKEENESEIFEEFVPTSEWQPIKKGQPIPKGLHVRINLQTGEREAKLISKSDSKRTDVLSISDDESVGEDAMPDARAQTIRESLINIEHGDQKKSEELAEEIRKKFRSYKEIKETFEKLNMTVKTDLEIINELLAKYKLLLLRKDKNADDEKLAILTDLELLVHQFDNAREFVRLAGVVDVVLPLLNSSRSDLRSEAAHLLGSAAQSNARVQIDALGNGAIAALLRGVVLDSSAEVRARSLYALSCLIRNFPAAQGTFLKEGGLSVLAKLFDKEGQEDRKLQVKAVTLLHDLLLERQGSLKLLKEGTNVNKEELKMKIQQYNAVSLEEQLLEQGWCSRISQLLLSQDSEWSRTKRRDDMSSAIMDWPVRPEHDIVEKVINAMLAMTDLCHNNFIKDRHLNHMLRSLTNWYNDLSAKESSKKVPKTPSSDSSENSEDDSDDMYYSGLADMLVNLTTKLNEYDRKDEL